MYNFLVLGLIPGTNIQIGFWTWIIIMSATAMVYKKYRQPIIESVARWWHQFDDDLEGLPHKAQHASRLHLRGL